MSSAWSSTPWSLSLFGELAESVGRAVPLALREAERRALAGHEAMGLTSKDVYGHLWQTQHEELVRHIGGLDGVRTIRPRGARYDLLVVGENNVILYPWRYGDDLRKSVDQAKMRMSEVRRNLLDLTPTTPDAQLSLEEADKSEEQLRTEAEEAEQIVADMATAGRMVLIAYASNPQSGLLRIYWGEATQTDESGLLKWSVREQLPITTEEGGFGRGWGPAPSPVRPVPPSTGPGSGPRFDDAPLEEPVLGVRPPLTSPDTDPNAPQPGTGSDD
ncbi:hypothetical protein [Actinokineospora bangkokensis]|uniref:Uncharacterized protein n=1 Tax=Actinokineospora bangkokensis TaxID=1193682 RepID=A0A1Q9LIS3_9PSEU|nr:hypothetical protein [Actinokineospora bangkokensis]OLR91951.1 hypothetical protein BJP25_24330 [Actinokineospora bangkokensis]